MDLNGASAIVTGGTGGLGSATVRKLVAEGAVVGILDVAEERAAPLLEELGDRVRFHQVDVLDEGSLQRSVSEMAGIAPLRVSVAAHGGLVSDAGRLVKRDGSPHSLAGFRSFLDPYLVGTFNVMRLAAAAMSANEPTGTGERGVVVNTASIAGYEGQIGQVAYAAAKGGVIGMTLVAARDMAVSGVRIVTIAPGVFYTPAYGDPDQAEQHFGATVPFPNRMGRADEYALLVSQIVANPYLNGEVVRLDGALRFGPK